MKKLLLIVFVLVLSGCSIIEVTQTRYKREMPDLPQKEQIGIGDVGAVAVGATEINKGINELYYMFKSADGLALDEFKVKAKSMLPKIKILLDFSYNVMGFLGVAWESIDWSDPEKWLAQAKEKQSAMETALKGEKERTLKLEQDVADFTQKLAEKEKIVKDKGAELEAQDGKWSAKFSWWFKFLIWIIVLLCILGLVWYCYQVFIKYTAGLPLKVAAFGGKTAAKGLTQLVKGMQRARVKIFQEKENGATPEEKVAYEKVWDILHKELSSAGNEEVHQLVDDIKNKHNLTRTDDKV